MVFVHDAGSVFDVPLDDVWAFVGSGDHHSDAHLHRDNTRERLTERSGRYAWEQTFDGVPTRFTMRWTSFHPVGIAYDVLEGPFSGSKFFLYYIPMGARTGVGVIGEFISPTLPEATIGEAVDRFFSTEFEQDHAAMLRDRSTSGGRRPA